MTAPDRWSVLFPLEVPDPDPSVVRAFRIARLGVARGLAAPPAHATTGALEIWRRMVLEPWLRSRQRVQRLIEGLAFPELDGGPPRGQDFRVDLILGIAGLLHLDTGAVVRGLPVPSGAEDLRESIEVLAWREDGAARTYLLGCAGSESVANPWRRHCAARLAEAEARWSSSPHTRALEADRAQRLEEAGAREGGQPPGIEDLIRESDEAAGPLPSGP